MRITALAFPGLSRPCSFSSPAIPDGGRRVSPCTEDAARQAHRRNLNESVDAMPGVFVCECGDPRCTRKLTLSLREYESVRSHPNHFVVAANHENPDAESVVAENVRYAVVETLVGEASKVALRTDPRALYSDGVRSTASITPRPNGPDTVVPGP